MSTTLLCPTCAKPLAPNAPQGLCPECLLRAGFPTVNQTAAALNPHSSRRTPFTPPTTAELTPLFPQLEILECIGQGGMGSVYRARQPALDRIVALKILRPPGDGDFGFAERFTREARALAKLNHPNIVAVHDYGQAGHLHYLLMEFVDGTSLRHLLASGTISPKEALAIVPPICDALQFAHDQGIVHRDIKPENILLAKTGTVKLADFGLAKLIGADPQASALTGAGDIMGTPHYMAPEQIEKPQEVDHRADIYSLGVVFYQMLTGELPLGRFSPPSRKVQIDVRLDEIVLRSLEKEPALRYQQISGLKTDVETVATTEPTVPATADPASTPMSSPANSAKSKMPWWLILIIAVASLFALATVVAFVAFRLWFREMGNARELAEERRAQAIAAMTAAKTSAEARREKAAAEMRSAMEKTREAAKRDLEIPNSHSAAAGEPNFNQTPTIPAAATTAPTDFDHMESNPAILRLLLQQAVKSIQVIEVRSKTGLTTELEVLEAKAEAALLRARLAGDRLAFARTKLATAEYRLRIAAERFASGLTNSMERDAARTEVEIAKVRLAEAEAMTPAPSSGNAELSPVPFLVGKQQFKSGDSIVIEQVLATSAMFAVGGKVTVRGHYQLASASPATLGLFVTHTSRSGKDDVSPTQAKQVEGASGSFELSCEITSVGDLHLSFYPVSGGESFGDVYFTANAP